MKTALIIGGAILVFGGIAVLASRKSHAANAEPALGFPPPPPPSIPAVGDSRTTKGISAKSLCQAAYNANGQLISQVPNKYAGVVGKTNDVLGSINCGAVGVAEKVVNSVVVTPAKAVVKFVGGIF